MTLPISFSVFFFYYFFFFFFFVLHLTPNWLTLINVLRDLFSFFCCFTVVAYLLLSCLYFRLSIASCLVSLEMLSREFILTTVKWNFLKLASSWWLSTACQHAQWHTTNPFYFYFLFSCPQHILSLLFLVRIDESPC